MNGCSTRGPQNGGPTRRADGTSAIRARDFVASWGKRQTLPTHLGTYNTAHNPHIPAIIVYLII